MNSALEEQGRTNMNSALEEQGRANMRVKTVKTAGLSIALAVALLVAVGGSNAFALSLQWPARVMNARERLEARRGFNDGLIAGRRDALARFSFYPAGSSRYQVGGFNYRQGFRRGYSQAYWKVANSYAHYNSNGY
jgi:hypothetical protein